MGSRSLYYQQDMNSFILTTDTSAPQVQPKPLISYGRPSESNSRSSIMTKEMNAREIFKIR